MSSASVFYPQLLTDTKHIRSSNMTPDRNYRPNLIAISTVRRNIFGPVDHEECRNFVEMHLNQHQIESMDYWGFDFVNEIPRPSKRSRFMWETVPDKTTTRPQKKQCCEPEHDITHLYPEPLDDIRLEQEENTVPPKSNSPVTDKTKQSLITGECHNQLLFIKFYMLKCICDGSIRVEENKLARIILKESNINSLYNFYI